MTAFLAVVLAVLTFAFVTYPLFRRRPLRESLTEDEELRELHSKRDTTYAMLKELEFDFQSGIITGEDYRDLESRYKSKAIAVLSSIDDAKKGANAGEAIEKQVRKLRQKKGANMDEALEREILNLRRSKGRFCPQCGTVYQQGARFCSHCGTSLGQGGSVD